ncbi:MAG: efflux RND transporter periplasmic adaptor subunit [Cyclobacteriaceae bacterium]|nr:efflux RND transporter periplasmic adaptor subunit [Cyclobacteriaceae bacterium]
MKSLYLIIITTALMAACTSGSDNSLDSKKKELESAQKELASLKERITTLEKEISAADPEFAKQHNKAILVSTFVAERKPFEHKVEIRGSVESRRNVLISSQVAGEIVKVHVREGQAVNKGQVLVSLNAEVIRNTIAELKTALELATSVYEKQSKLWEQKIGTEIQYLQAKNNKESLERKLATAYSQLDQAIVKAPFSGTVDQLPAREGELASPGVPLVRVVSLTDAYIKADVSERFIGKFKSGDPVVAYFPSIEKRINTTISSVSQVINEENRTFLIEVNMPKVNFIIKPNQVVVLELRDYINENALSVPTRIIQRDEEGQFIFTIENRNEKLFAHKVHVTTGISSTTLTEILDGIQGNEKIVDQGYRDLSEGVEVEIADEANSGKDLAKK